MRQLDAVSRHLLRRLWAAGAGPADLAAPVSIDIDSTIAGVCGRSKQGAACGCTTVRGCAGVWGHLPRAGESPCPGRLVRSARRDHLRLPDARPWQEHFTTAMTRIDANPAPT